ncbi:MAG: tetratricopeptide repeat protein [Nitrospina sp.]|jgi:protein O-mannosyl-transferase|nr:tetratricopeptide repeat protein [Nitrospina sp.]MBT3509886.1 tetratricopeptide repeat protein [Nitrospina sp.]MBT3874482.1 tetratricopeptide repeat protein [Nitrospina sp.]MBT4049114.1 tetratricopeptide repeat protein [Nitrospina sp.]MBT4559152.1 tetratricopeptide repeat protein [Nitrospina sp.]
MKRVPLLQSPPTFSFLTAFFIIFLFVIIAFGGALNNKFLSWDDADFVYNNPMIQSIDTERLFQMTTSFHTGNWYPLTWISHAVDYALFGSNPFGHHLTSILIHGVNAFLVFLLFQRLLSLAKNDFSSANIFWGGVAAALLFGLHPLRVESVVWISQRKDLLCAFFVLTCYWVYLSYANASEQKSSRRWYIGVLLLFLCALASKPMAVTVPIILLLLDVYPLRRFSRTAVLEKIPLFIISMGISVVTLKAQGQAGAVVSVDKLDLVDRGLNAIRSIAFYPLKTLWPVNLTALYPFPSKLTPLSIWFSGSLLLILGVTLFCYFQFNKGKSFWLVAWLYYLVSLVPVLGIVQVGGQAAADRYTYLPMISFFFLSGLGLVYWVRVLDKSRYLMMVCGTVLIVGLTGLTQKQVKVWVDDETLWRHTVQVFPDRLPRARLFLGWAYLEGNALEASELEFHEALKMHPLYAKAYSGLGVVEYRRGRLLSADKNFKKALTLDFEFAEAYNGLGLVEYKHGHLQSAEINFKKALALDSQFTEARINLGLVLYSLERFVEAETQYLKSLARKRDSVEVHNNLGLLYYRQGRLKEAEAHYMAGLNIDFEFSGLHLNLGNLYRTQGRMREAVEVYKKSIRFNAHWAMPHNHLGEVYLQLGLLDNAESEFSAAVVIDPENELARKNLLLLRSDPGKK